ncbi:hypothetical protein CCAX7_61790 [Capsulimonas corticalis]|uniref:Uncharacterized protein n=1 Tax=Capsulimonas corticalis TaxID=2219043 RepID=A0A402CWF3_9BACT|nr:hypothetical protein [Capsulimonas corticalis]BDI34128.1 hypothetical protein CCAX7_61790 [Capsulimonas corticalis]
MTLLTASLYLLCLAFLLGSAVFVLSRNPGSRLHGYYSLLAIALLGWVGTLFVFGSLPEGRTLLLVGRANFAAAALVATASYLFMAELAGRGSRLYARLWLETSFVVAVSAFTPLIDGAETVQAGQHLTAYGVLFPLYIAHVVAMLGGAVATALRPGVRLAARDRNTLKLIGAGILATASVAVTTNIVLPYWYGDFRLINVGTLSTILLLGTVAYAVFVQHLFNIRVIVRTTVIYAVIISFALEVYQAAVAFLADLLPLGNPTERHFAATAIALIINATTNRALKDWLERVVDHVARKGRPMPAEGRS